MPPAPLNPDNDLAQRQEALARALTTGSPPPPGFDAGRIQLTARSLLAKRTSAAARSWPALVDGIGEAFSEQFHAYARTNPLAEGASPLDDLLRFARDLSARRSLPIRAARLYCMHEAHRRRLAWARDGVSGRCIIAIRLSFLGARCFSIPGFRRESR